MGWFDGKYEGKKVLLSDGALDRTQEYLEQLAAEYEEGVDRKPTIEELAALLTAVLGTGGEEYLEDFESRRVTRVALEVEKKKKDQAWAVGDVLAIPLGDRVAFARIMTTEGNPFGPLVEVFRKTSSRMFVTPEILESGRAMHPSRVGLGGAVRAWRWTVVSSDPKYKPSKEDEKLEFWNGDGMPDFWAENLRGKKVRDITAAERKQMQGTGAGTPEDFEREIAKALKLPPPGKKTAKGKGKKKSR